MIADLSKNLFNQSRDNMKIIEKIKTYEDACQVEGVDPVKSLPYPEPQNDDEKAINGVAKMFRIGRVLNEGWLPDWSNKNEYKYYPWFGMQTYSDQISSSTDFSYIDYVYVDSFSYVSSRGCFKSGELAEYAGKQFLSTYREFMVIERS
ncbi:MAG: hypothetical protein WBP45_14955 [Daejeonella sp.]